jgi:hypothetical protein
MTTKGDSSHKARATVARNCSPVERHPNGRSQDGGETEPDRGKRCRDILDRHSGRKRIDHRLIGGPVVPDIGRYKRHALKRLAGQRGFAAAGRTDDQADLPRLVFNG